MSNIIPGVPTPSDPTCALTVCGSIIAQVDCIKYIMQGTSACIDIQFFAADGTPLDLDRFCDIQIQLTNEFDCVVANFWYPDVPTGSRGFDIEILQYTTTGGHIVNKGLLRICLSSACTLTSPTSIFAEILLKECLLTGEQQIITGVPTPTTGDSFGIPCLMIAKITESKIAKNGGAGGCFPGYIPPAPGSSGIGFAIGSTGSTGPQGHQGFIGSTGLIGSTGPQGIVGFAGSTGAQGDQGFTGATGSQGDQGFIGATGTQGDQGFIGATGSQGNQGDQGFVGGTGATGPQGDQGFIGATGSQGNQGDQGFIGGTGATGPQGDQGFIGSTGFTGSTGVQGEKGFNGATGNIGSTGATGFTGATGGGATGATGPQGAGGALGYYGSFVDTTNQVLATVGSAQIVEINTTQAASGLSLDPFVNGRIVIANPGTYSMIYSIQLKNTDNKEHYADIWLKYNGNDYPDSSTRFHIPARNNQNLDGYEVATVNFVGTSTSPNDYVELWWTADSATVSLETIPAGTSPVTPLTPSVICTLTQVMYTQLGATGNIGATGATGIQGNIGSTGATGLQGATGNGSTGATGLQGATGVDTSTVLINSQAGNYTLALSDKGNLVEITAAGTVTVPLNSSVAFPIGSQIIIVRATVNAVDIAGAAGVTINSANSFLNLNYQYSSATLIKQGTDTWYLFGDLKA